MKRSNSPGKQRRARRSTNRRLASRRLLSREILEPRNLLSADPVSSWQNPIQATDVNNDGHVSPIDALNVINALNSGGARDLSSTPGPRVTRGMFMVSGNDSSKFLDVNGDNMLTAIDALAVINQLNAASSHELMRIRLETTDLAGNPITTIEVGQDFLVRGLVTDLRDGGQGVFSAYVDVLYDPSLTSVNGAIAFSPEFPNSRVGDTSQAGLIDEVGALDSDTSPPGERLLFSVPFTATAEGVLNFTADENDEEFNDLGLHGIDVEILTSDVEYVSTSIQIGSAPTLSVDEATLTEGNSGQANMEFTVTLSKVWNQPVTVDFATAGVTATAGVDFTSTSGTLTIPAGQTTGVISVPILGDAASEADETFTLTLSNPTGAAIAMNMGVATGTIEDDDVGISVENADPVAEGTGGAANVASFVVTLSKASAVTVTVNYTTVAGSAASPADFTAQSGTLTFTPGQTSKMVNVPIIADAVDEVDEAFGLVLSAATNAIIVDGQATAVIFDDDATISIDDVTIEEGDENTKNVVLTVSLVRDKEMNVSVDYTTADGTAADQDFNAQSGTVTFTPSTTTMTITLQVLGDMIDENDETFFVELSNPINGAITKNRGMVTITDNDAPPTITIDPVQVAEGDQGTTDAVFTVTLSQASGKTITVDFATMAGTAAEGDDFEATNDSLTFLPGETTKMITVPVVGDEVEEENETFTVNLSNAVNATIMTGEGVGTITNDDTPPTISISNAEVVEGDDGEVDMTFTVTLSHASNSEVTVKFATANDTAEEPDDYTALMDTLTFAPNETTKTITIKVQGDTDDEGDEAFNVVLSDPTNATIMTGTGVGTITNDDTPPTISISSPTVDEGDDGEVDMTFTVTLSHASNSEVTVKFATANGSAEEPGDYTAQMDTLTFAAGETTKMITIKVQGDTDDEGDETFNVVLSEPMGATIMTGTGVGTITNDDVVPTISISDKSITELDDEDVDMVFTVTLSEVSTKMITVDFATMAGTAAADEDFDTATGTLTFMPGDLEKTITVKVKGDTVDEGNETFNVILSNAVNATIPEGTATGTIIDNDADPTISIEGAIASEENTGTKNMVFNVRLSSPSGKTITVDFATMAGTAMEGSDFTPTMGTLTFAPNDESKQIMVPIIGDMLDEADETFTVVLSNPTNATIMTGTATGTITDNDLLPIITINDIDVTEEDSTSETIDMVFTVNLSEPSGRAVSVNFTTVAGTATANDFTPVSGTLHFAAGETSKTITVPIRGDLLNEANETFIVRLNSLMNATFTTVTDTTEEATGRILDNDPPPSLTIADVVVTEGDDGNVTAVFDVALSAPSGQTVTVAFATANGTAIAGTDFVAQTGTLTFAPGTISNTISIVVSGDRVVEGDENFRVNLSNPVNATITDGEAIGTITDQDERGSLSGFVYVDANNNGVKDAAETGITGVTITLEFRVGTTEMTFGTVVTGADGSYRFENVEPGREYRITQTQPVGFVDGRESLGSLGGTVAADVFFATLGSGQHGVNYNFGELGLAPTTITRRNFMVPRVI